MSTHIEEPDRDALPADVDPLYPRIHPRPPRNWVNDPNGLVHHNGRWHLFAQASPDSATGGDICWWHADSADLVHWTDRGIALRPHLGDDTRPDRDGVWSGNAISYDGDLVAFYSAFRTDTAWQPMLSAVSADDGLTFTDDGTVRATAPEVVVLPDGTRTTAHTLRDPFVWADPDPAAPGEPRWSLLLGAGLDVVEPGDGAARYAAVLRFTSDDLDRWTYAGVFHHLPVPAAGTTPDTGEMWECPAYAEIPDAEGNLVSVLIICGWYRTSFPARAIALLADRSGDLLTQRAATFLEDGDALYAPSVLHAPDGRVLLWGWIRELRDLSESVAAGWTGALTFPREVTIRDGSLASWPAAELDLLRSAAIDVADDTFAVPVAVELLLDGHAGPVTVHLHSGSTELTLRLDTDTRRAAVGDVELDAATSSVDGRPWLRVFVDGSVLEAFTSAGRAVTTRTYPRHHAGWTARVEGATGAVHAWNLDGPAMRADSR
jgi:beta-fructofuranosidase